MLQIDGFQFNRLVQSRNGIQLYEGVQLGDQKAVIAKLLPDPSRLPHLALGIRHAHEIGLSFPDLDVPKPLFLDRSMERIISVSERPPGCTLQAFVTKGLLETYRTMDRLELVLHITKALAKFHDAQLFHLHLQARHILIREQSHKIHFLDLTTAVFHAEHMTIPSGIHKPLNYLSDTLAPEQLGLLDRPVDARADLFQLGCLIFEIFADRSPFPAKGEPAVRMTHSPLSLEAFNSQLPSCIYQIVGKLLHFDPDLRYLSVHQLLEDLEQCHGFTQDSEQYDCDLQQTQPPNIRLQNIPLARTRPQTKERLHALLNQMLSGKHTWVTLSGPAGHDKSHLIRDLKGHVTSKGGLFIESACDPAHKLTPHGPLRGAIGTWIDLLASHYPHILEEMQRKTQRALGKNSGLMEGIIPNWQKLAPSSASLVDLPANMARNRFKFAFREFVTTFLNTPIPVVLVFDDMQWADDSSLELLNLIRHSVQPCNLMVIAAFRGKHPNNAVFQNWQAEHFEIGPLETSHIEALLHTYYPAPDQDSAALAALLFQCTNGTPYSMWRLFAKMEREQLLVPNADRSRWQWDLEHLRTRLPRWHLKDWVRDKVNQIPSETQQALAHAALIGRTFNLEEWSTILNTPLTELRDHLIAAMHAGLILPRAHNFAYLTWMTRTCLETQKVELAFRFVNNLVQASLKDLLPMEQSAKGFAKLAHYYASQQNGSPNASFWVADCYQSAVEMGANTDWMTRVVAMMRAGREAKNQHALSSASHYYARAVDLCEDPHWEEHFELLYKLHLEAIECAYLRRDEHSSAWIHETLIEKAKLPTQRSEIFHKRATFLRGRIRLEDALTTYIQALAELGLELCLNGGEKHEKLASDIEAAVAKIAPEDVPKLPQLKNVQLRKAAQILSEILPLAYFISQRTFLSVVYHSLKLMIEEGLGDGTPRVLGAYATLLVDRDPARARAISEIATHLDRNQVRQIPDPGANGFLLIFVKHWFVDVHLVLQELKSEIQSACEIGDMDGFNYGMSSLYASQAAHGYNLLDMRREAETTMPMLHEFNLTFAASMITIWGQFVQQLTSHSRRPWLLNIPALGALLDPETEPKSQLEHNLRLQFHCAQVMLALIFREVELAVVHADLAEKNLNTSPRMPNVSKLFFNSTLAYIQYIRLHPDKAVTYQPRIDQKLRLLEVWAEFSPSNRNHELLLVRAELASPQDDMNAVIELYDRAIEAARQNGFPHDQALASEFAFEFYLTRNREVISRTYLSDARNLYQEWGAASKVKQLNQRVMRLDQSGSANAEMIEKLNRMNREIEKSQKQLMEQEPMANLGNLTAGITHEIRNPLNFITNFAAVGVELLDDLRQILNRHHDHLGEDFNDVITMVEDLANNNAIIQKQGARAENIVRAMLRASRSAKDNPRPTDLNQLLDEDINLAYHGHAKKTGLGVVIHREYGEGVGKVDVVARNISRVFLNLLNNAFYALAERKSAGNGDYQPEIWVRTRNETAHVLIDVIDNGTGIEPDILATVFTPFFTTKPTGEGTGIGLAMSKEIIEQEHGGSLSVTSTLRGTTTFTIRLPRKQASESS